LLSARAGSVGCWELSLEGRKPIRSDAPTWTVQVAVHLTIELCDKSPSFYFVPCLGIETHPVAAKIAARFRFTAEFGTGTHIMLP
jgi:hypothetical protein